MKFVLADGQIKFLTHRIEWEEIRKIHQCSKIADGELIKQEPIETITTKVWEVYSAEQKDLFITKLAERNITPLVIEYDQPSIELKASCEDKIFNSYDDASIFVETGIVPKTELDILRETVDALVIASLEV